MGYQALLFCPDEKLASVVRQVFGELEFTLDPAEDPFAAVKKLMAQHYDVIVVEGENEQNAALLFKSARNSSLNQGSLAIALVEGQAGVAKAYRIGANLVLTKPINVEQAKGTLRVARGLLRKSSDATGSAGAPQAPAKLVVSSSGIQPDRRGARIVAPAPSRIEVRDFEAPWPGAGPQPGLDESQGPTAGTRITEAPAPQPTIRLATTGSEIAGQSVSSATVKNNSGKNSSTHDGAVPDKSEANPGSAVPSPGRGFASTPAAGTAAAPASAKSGTTSANRIVEAETVKASEDKSAAINPVQTTPILASPAQTSPAPAKPAPESSSPDKSSVGVTPAPSFSSVKASDAPSFARLDDDVSGGGFGQKKLLLAAIFILAIAAIGYLVFGKLGGSGTPAAPPAVISTPEKVRLEPAPVASPGLGSSSATHEAIAPETNASLRANSATHDPTSHDSASKETARALPSNLQTGAANVNQERVSLKSTPSSTADSDVEATPHPLRVKSNAGAGSSQTRTEEAAPQISGLIADVAPKDSKLANLITSAPSSLPRMSPANLRISQGVSEGLLIKRVQPKYPPAAVATHAEGSVQIQATINKEGYVTNTKVIRGNSLLAAAALDAVRQWRYKPYYLDGQPVEIQTQITVNFRAQ